MHSTEELHKIYDLAYCKQRTFYQKYSPHDRAIEAVATAVRSERPSAAQRDHEAEKLDEALVEKLAEHAVTSRQVVSAILRGAPPITSIEKAIVEAVIAWRRQFPRDKTGNLGIFMEPIAKAADDWLASLRPIPERPAQRE